MAAMANQNGVHHQFNKDSVDVTADQEIGEAVTS
jgi:hypothetical protein